MSAARRLEARTDLVRAAEWVLESARGGTIPMVSGQLDLDELETTMSVDVTTRLLVSPRPIAGLYEVQAEARATVRGQDVVVTITTQVWQP